jgi:hypothetical protein
MNPNGILNSTLPSSLDELLKQLQDQDVEELATKLVNEYMERIR